jgi:hypothetical protein
VEQKPYRKSTFKKWSKNLIENPIDFGSATPVPLDLFPKGGKRWKKVG